MLLTLRKHNRHQAMVRLQQIALELFEDRGFAAVTVRDVADCSGISESTIYRYFGTKEHLVVWDPYDGPFEDSFGSHLRAGVQPLKAFVKAYADVLEAHSDSSHLLRRARLIYSEPEIAAAALAQDSMDRTELAGAFAANYGRRKPTLGDECEAAVCLAAIYVAIDYWQREDGAGSLIDLIEVAFETLEK